LKKRLFLRSFAWIVGILVILFAGFYIYITHFHVFTEPPTYTSACNILLKNLRTTIIDFYLPKHRNVFPAEWEKDEYSWVISIESYLNSKYGHSYKMLNSRELFYCPLDKERKKSSSYIFNRKLAGRKIKDFNAPEKIILLFESGNPHFKKSHCIFLDGHIELMDVGATGSNLHP